MTNRSPDSTPQTRTDQRRAADPQTPGPQAHEIRPVPKTVPTPAGGAKKDAREQASCDEPMTGPQASDLKTLSEEAGTSAFRPDLSRAEAALLIDELKDARQNKR